MIIMIDIVIVTSLKRLYAIRISDINGKGKRRRKIVIY